MTLHVNAHVNGTPIWEMRINNLGHPDPNADPSTDDLRRYEVNYTDGADGTTAVCHTEHHRGNGSEILVALALAEVRS